MLSRVDFFASGLGFRGVSKIGGDVASRHTAVRRVRRVIIAGLYACDLMSRRERRDL